MMTRSKALTFLLACSTLSSAFSFVPMSSLNKSPAILDKKFTNGAIRQFMVSSSSDNNNNSNEDMDEELMLSMKSSGKILSESSFGASDVPESQRPANEYLDLIRQPLFGWAAQDKGVSGLAIRFGVVYAAFFGVISYPIAGATFTQDGYELQKLACSNVATLLVLLILCLRLYSGWGYVGSRLQSNIVEYEETGWYDGQYAVKTEKEKARDLFLYRTDVQPVENRIKAFAAAIGVLWIASCVGLNVVMKQKPLFNEYDPALLERLVYDEKAADIAARQSNGRPTYCDSRYYRAVANGGQGC